VQSISNDGYTIGLDKKAEGTLLRKDVIKGERFRLHEHVRALIVEVKDTARNPQILLSRTDRKFLFRLLEIDVPEIFHGIVEVRSIAREPGARAKIAVSATQQGIDPVGACVGIQGKRIQPIVKELHDEKIDVIEWNPDPAIFISKAISPAKVVGVYLGNGKTATVVVPEDQLSLAIGRDGQNARLAAKLTSWRIDIKSVTEAASDIIGIFESKRDLIEHNDETGERTTIITHKELFDGEEKSIDSIRVILSKRNEGRNLSVDEIETLNRFVDRIEKRKVAGFNESNVSEVIRTLMNSQLLKEDISKKHINESGLPKHVAAILQNAGLFTFGDLYERMKKDPDEIFKLQGISTKSMNEIASLVKFIGISTSVEPNMQTVPTEMNSDSGIASESTALEVPAEVENQAETEPEKLIAETVIIPQVQTESEMTESIPEKPVEQEETEDISFDELFNTIRTDAISHVDYIDDEDEDRIDGNTKKDKKKKKKKNVQVEYDPESDVTLVHKKHKRTDDEDWGW
jgi:N utilization substance protein A